MKLTTAVKEEDLIARVSGDLDHHSAAGIRQELDRMLLACPPKRLLLDLSGTDFMDSSGLGLILGRKRKTEELGVELILINPSEPCQKLLRLAGMDTQIEMKFM